MKKKWVYGLLFVILLGEGCIQKVSAQATITLEECLKLAKENYPLIRQHDLIEQAKDYTVSNLSKNYLPQLSLMANASWQSEAMKIPLKLPKTMDVKLAENLTVPVEIPEIKLPEGDKEHVSVGLGFTQVLWDGGRIGAGKDMARAEAEMMHGGVEAQLYAIRSKVKDLFFGVLLIDGRMKQLDEADEILNTIRKRVEVALEHGVVFSTDLDAVDVERLKYKQQRSDLEVRRSAFLKMLSRFIHRPLASSTDLQTPGEKMIRGGEEIKRPELNYLNLKKRRLDADLKMNNAELMPKFGLFVTGSYGKPGFSVFDNGFSFSAIAGVSFSWKFGKLYTRKHDRAIIEIQKEGVGLELESFVFNTRMELEQQNMEIERLKKLLQDDAEIVRLHENIMKVSQTKYENGVCTIADLIKDVNSFHVATLEKLIRELELKMSLYSWEIVAGE